MITLMYCDISKNKKTMNLSYRFEGVNLPSVFLQDIYRYRNYVNRIHHMVSRLMLIQALEESNMLCELKDWRRTEKNKPILPSWNNFNFSYSQDFVVFAYSARAIGVDIEAISSDSCLDISNQFHPAEKNFITYSNNPEEDCLTLWVKKEALLKAVGIGITSDLSINCIKDYVFYNDKMWYFHKLDVFKNKAIIYMCTQQINETVVYKKFKI